MPTASEAKTSRLYEWVKSNGIVAITIVGVLLYIIFSIPATFFYARLGTTPSEVGISYTSILSGSTLGALLIVAALMTGGIYVLAFLLGWLSYTIFYFTVKFLRHPRLMLTRDQDLDLDRFEQKLMIVRSIHEGSVSNWQEIERALRRNRYLEREEHWTPADFLEIHAVNKRKVYMKIFMSNILSVAHMLRRSVKYLYPLILLFIITATVILIVIANAQAGEVLQGRSYLGSQIGLFDYHAEKVTIRPASATTKNILINLTGKQVFLLGENAQYIIIYLPGSRLTTRIPVSAVIVSSSP